MRKRGEACSRREKDTVLTDNCKADALLVAGALTGEENCDTVDKPGATLKVVYGSKVENSGVNRNKEYSELKIHF